MTVHNNKNILLYPVGDKIKCLLWGFSFIDFINSNGIWILRCSKKEFSCFNYSVKISVSYTKKIQTIQYCASKGNGVLGYHLNELQCLHKVTCSKYQQTSKGFQTVTSMTFRCPFSTTVKGEYCDTNVILPLASCWNFTGKFTSLR